MAERSFDKLHLPYKAFKQQRGRQLEDRLAEMFAGQDTISPTDLNHALKTVLDTQSEDHRNDWLELERWGDRLRDQFGSTGGTLLPAPSCVTYRRTAETVKWHKDAAWTVESGGGGVTLLNSGRIQMSQLSYISITCYYFISGRPSPPAAPPNTATINNVWATLYLPTSSQSPIGTDGSYISQDVPRVRASGYTYDTMRGTISWTGMGTFTSIIDFTLDSGDISLDNTDGAVYLTVWSLPTTIA